MTKPFLITGLPRSRTAWFSVLAAATQTGVCSHEPTQHGQWYDVCSGIWNFSTAEHTGISDSALGFNIHEILRDFKPRTLIVVRDHEDVLRSLAKQGITGVETYVTKLAGRFLGVAHNPLVKFVEYEDLNDLDKVLECLDWLMPGGVGHEHAAHWVMPLNIQKKIDWPAAANADLATMIGQDVVKELKSAALSIN